MLIDWIDSFYPILVLKKAIETIEDPERLLRCKEIIIEARARTDQAVKSIID